MSLKELNTQGLVEFKGNKSGIIVNIKGEAPFEEIKKVIIDKLESYVGFFSGAKICKINCDYLDDIEILDIKDSITSKFDVGFIEDIENEEIREFNTKYVNNLRSGEDVRFEGDVVVLNDMKPGSQVNSTLNTVVLGNISAGARVVSGGNVVVMGEIEGFVHAGANGNEAAYVIARKLNPKILQIAGNIAEAPDEEDTCVEEEDTREDRKFSGPEIAFINDGRIVIESYL